MNMILDFLKSETTKNAYNKYAIELLIDYIYEAYLFLETKYEGENEDLKLVIEYLEHTKYLNNDLIYKAFEKMILNYEN